MAAGAYGVWSEDATGRTLLGDEMGVPTIASGALRKLLAALSKHGVRPEEALTPLGLDARAVDDPDGRVPIERLHAAWDLFFERAPAVDVVHETMYEPGDYGLVGFVAMSSATLEEALGHVVRFLSLWTDDPALDLAPDGTMSVYYRHVFRDSNGARAATEDAPIELIHGVRQLSQRRVVPRLVTFRHPAPRHAAALMEHFGCEVRYSAPRCTMVLRPADLAVPLPRADVHLAAFLQKTAKEALERRGATDETPLTRVREILAEELQRGAPSIGQVARRCASTERTLRRRLEENGTTFRDLLDDTRARLAQGYLADRQMPLTQVAFLVGFSEPSTFYRAFKRWTGLTPAAFRARM